jgi:hypothetical protein
MGRKNWSKRSRRRENGQEILEFTLVTWLILIPMFLGMIRVGLNLVRTNQVVFITSDLATMYVQGQDFSTYSLQNLATRLATGLDLEVGSSFTGNNAANTGNGGSVIVTMTKMMYVGTDSQPTCLSVGASGSGKCKNASSFVYLQRVSFGNAAITGAPASLAGTPNSSIVIDSGGNVTNYLTDTNAQLPATADAAMDNLWSPGTANGLQDGQIVYLTEMYFDSTSFAFGTTGQGVYAKYFF